MKKGLLIIFSLLMTIASIAQSPEGFKYQAVIRDASNNVLTNQNVGIRMAIKQGSIAGTSVYTETFNLSTNNYGLLNLEIGSGVSLDDFTAIDWAAATFFIETAVDISGGTSYSVMGTSQLLSVPYALHSKTAQHLMSGSDTLWEANGNDISNQNSGNVGIGNASPVNPLSVLQATGTANTVRLESQTHPTGKDLLELIVPTGSTAGSQFIEMQNGNAIVAAINSDGSAEFKSVEFDDNTVQTTAAIGPIAFGSIATSGSINSGSGGYTVVWNSTNNRYEITITGKTYHFSNFTTLVTPATSTVRAVRTSSVSGKLLVYLYNSTGTNIQANFHFITYE